MSFLFFVLQRDRIDAPSVRYRLGLVDVVNLGRASERRGTQRGRLLELGIDDQRVSASHARLVREGGGFVVEDLGSRNGTSKNGVAVTRAT